MHDVKLLRDFGQPNLNLDHRPPPSSTFWNQRHRHSRRGPDRCRRERGQSGADRQSSATTWWCDTRSPIVIRNRPSREFGCSLLPANAFHWRNSPASKLRTVLTTFTAKATAATSAVTFNVRGRDLDTHRRRCDQADRSEGETAAGLSPWLVGRVREREAGRSAAGRDRAPDYPRHLHHPLHHVSLVQMGAAHSC